MNGKTMVKAALVALPVISLWAVAQLRVPVDRDARKQAETAVREAQQEGNPAATLRAYRRWLEFYPNEPAVEAGIYRAIALVSEQSGESEQAKTWNEMAGWLDSGIDQRLNAGGSTTRGGPDKLAALLAAIGQTAQTTGTVRQTFRTANGAVAPVPMQPQSMFPQQPVGAPGFQPQPVMQPMPGYLAQPMALMPGQPMPVAVDAQGNPIPQAQPMPIAVDAQGNPIPQAQPMPIAVDAQGNPIPQTQPMLMAQAQPVLMAQAQPMPMAQAQPMPMAQAQPMPMAQAQPMPMAQAQPMPMAQAQPMPMAQAQPMPVGQPQSTPQGQPQSTPQGQPQMQYPQPQGRQQMRYPQYPQAQMQGQPQTAQYPQAQVPGQPQMAQYPQSQTQGQPQKGYPPQQAQYPQYYAQRPAPYGAPAGYARPRQARRGDEAKPIRVFHDHSRLGDANYFEPPCGALLLVEGGNLTFTPTGGEAPLVIPAAEIVEIRMNTAVGKEVGAFHIITRKGLYLHLAPEGATSDEGRADVDELRQQLGLEQ
jgi:hypothetical protein